MKTGLIGCGVIGGALKKACLVKGIELFVFDKHKAPWNGPQNEVEVLNTELVFVCVPTPTNVVGIQEITAIVDVLSWLNRANYLGVVCLRSTVLPGTTEKLQRQFPKLNLTHCPEFLTEARPVEDLLAQPCVIVGSSKEDATIVLEQFWLTFDPSVKIYAYGSTTESELVKYVHNCFLATKVSFFNEIYEVCEHLKTNYDLVMVGAKAIGKIGESHTKVPGPDGQFGYGGMCFPKDMTAFFDFIKENGLRAETIGGAIQGNWRRRKL